MVSYKPLMRLLVEKDMSMRDLMLLAHIAPNTMTKIRRDEDVSMTILNRICEVLGCSYGDIMEYSPDNQAVYKQNNSDHI